MTDFKVGDKVKLTGNLWENSPVTYGFTIGSIHTVVLDEYGVDSIKDVDGDFWYFDEEGWEVELVESAPEQEPEVIGESPDLPAGAFNAPKSTNQELLEEVTRLQGVIVDLSGEIENLKSAQSYADSRTDRLHERANHIEGQHEKATADTLLLSQSVDDRFAGLNSLLNALVLSIPPEKFTEAELTLARIRGIDALTGKQ